MSLQCASITNILNIVVTLSIKTIFILCEMHAIYP